MRESRHQTLACEVHDSMGVSNGTTALGIAVALGEVPMPKAEQICKDLDLFFGGVVFLRRGIDPGTDRAARQ